ncbi:MAG: TetR/AcrR family transcriptional regulator [Acidimicrobiales bacterium]
MSVRLSADKRRSQLMAVALEAFGTNGYHDTSMNQVAEAAGITKPVVYQHFESKHALYLALLVDIGERLRNAISEALAKADSPRELVEAGLSAFFEFFGKEPHSFSVMFGDGVRSDSDFVNELEKVEESIVENIVAVLNIPEVDDDNLRVLAHGVVGLTEGIGRHWLERGFHLAPGDLAQQAAEMAYYGLRGANRN